MTGSLLFPFSDRRLATRREFADLGRSPTFGNGPSDLDQDYAAKIRHSLLRSTKQTRAPSQEMAGMNTNLGPANSSSGTSRTILVVEDDTFLLAAATDYLALAGHSVLTAANALEAVALLEENTSSIDAIFTDFNMPGEMDGLELARFAKAHWPQMIVFLTSGGPHTLSQRVGSIDGFFSKPYDIAEVADAIAERVKSDPLK